MKHECSLSNPHAGEKLLRPDIQRHTAAQAARGFNDNGHKFTGFGVIEAAGFRLKRVNEAPTLFLHGILVKFKQAVPVAVAFHHDFTQTLGVAGKDGRAFHIHLVRGGDGNIGEGFQNPRLKLTHVGNRFHFPRFGVYPRDGGAAHVGITRGKGKSGQKGGSPDNSTFHDQIVKGREGGCQAHACQAGGEVLVDPNVGRKERT